MLSINFVVFDWLLENVRLIRWWGLLVFMIFLFCFDVVGIKFVNNI